jgi:PAS domain-containing protein
MIFKKICSWVQSKTFNTPTVDKFISDIQDVHKDVKAIRKDLKSEREYIETKLQEKEAIIHALLDCVPDMMWYKDIDGKYLYANQVIKDGLLCTDKPIGRDDVDIALSAKKKYGCDNHTFGEKCAGSDDIVLGHGHSDRFVENGYVKGKWLELEVHKNVVRDSDGNIIGTVGVGRDITEYVEAINTAKASCGGCSVTDVFESNRYGDDMT